MKEIKELKRAGRKPKADKDKVVSRGVYLTNTEWSIIISKFGTPTNAMRRLLSISAP